MKKYCEFIGDDTTDFDEIGSSRRICEHKGISHCLLHRIRTPEDNEGWTRCCKECDTPFYEVEAT